MVRARTNTCPTFPLCKGGDLDWVTYPVKLGVVGSIPTPGTNKISRVDRNRYFALSFHTDCPNGRTRFRFLPGIPQCSSVGRAR